MFVTLGEGEKGKVKNISLNTYTKAKGLQSAQPHGQGGHAETATHAKHICPDEHKEDAQMEIKQNRGHSGFP